MKSLCTNNTPINNKIKAPLEFSPTNYPSDLSDEEWKIIEHLYPYGINAL